MRPKDCYIYATNGFHFMRGDAVKNLKQSRTFILGQIKDLTVQQLNNIPAGLTIILFGTLGILYGHNKMIAINETDFKL